MRPGTNFIGERRHTPTARASIRLASCALASLALASCATRVDLTGDYAGALLPPAPIALKASGEAVRPLALALMGAGNEEIASRTREARISALPGALGDNASFWAELSGDYPFDAIACAISGDPDWKLSGSWYVHAKAGISMGFSSGGALLLTNGDPKRFGEGGFLAGLDGEDRDRFDSSEFALVAFDPFASLFPGLLEEPELIPLGALMLSAERASPSDATVSVEGRFLFASEAKPYLLVSKVAWYGIASSLFPSSGREAALRPSLEVAGKRLVMTFEVDGEAFYDGVASVIPIRIR
jgi:hypothetical protein